MGLERIASGTRVFIDAPVLVYHFTGLSVECRSLLERCERGDVEGVTSVTVIAEVTHRLMMIEAVQAGLVSAGNVATKLQKKPEAIRKLHIASEQAARIPVMGITVLGLDLRVVLAASELRRRHGLMTNDSIIAATLVDADIEHLATGDRDFRRVKGVTVFEPSDLT